MDNFDFKKYLTENKLTSNSKLLTEIRTGRAAKGEDFTVVTRANSGQITSIKTVYVNTQLLEFLKGKREGMIDDARDTGDMDLVDYLEEFVSWEVDPDGKSGTFQLNDDEQEYYISNQKYPQECDVIRKEGRHSERIEHIIESIFTGEWYRRCIADYNSDI